MLSVVRFPVEIVLKPSAMSTLPSDMTASGHIYAVEAPMPESGLLRICSTPDASGRHTTVRLIDLNLSATAALQA